MISIWARARPQSYSRNDCRSDCSRHAPASNTQTLDLDGNVRFGPDVEALGDASESAANPDYWLEKLAASDAHLESIGRAAQDYLPNIDPAHLSPDYAGFRPNIAPPGSGFFDFVIRHVRERRGLIDLLGFASPGLTSSLATGERVARMVNRDIWKIGGSVQDAAAGWDR